MDEGIPRLAAGIDDGFDAVPDDMAELVLAQILPDIFLGIEFGGIEPAPAKAGGGSGIRVMLPGTLRYPPV